LFIFFINNIFIVILFKFYKKNFINIQYDDNYRILMEINMQRNISLIIIGILIFTGIGASAISIGDPSLYRSSSLDEYDMVIIIPEVFSTLVQPLVEHKNIHNIITFVKITEEIYTEYEGRDNAEQIKYFIKDAIETFNIKYVLLMGGKTVLGLKWNVPGRYVQFDDGFGYPEFLSDLYFADIYKDDGDFEDWDSNGNSVFAETGFSGDILDLEPDIAVGRLPCRTKKEVRTVVDKIITYEENTYGQSWFNRLVVIGGDTFPNYEGYEGEYTCDVASSYMDGFDIYKLYTSTGALTGPDDIINVVNQGCGFFFTRGRGGQDRIRMVNTDGLEFIAFQDDDISSLNNNGMYPICILNECIHGKFDVGIINYFYLLLRKMGFTIFDCVPECLAWRLIREENAGAIATITNTNICYGSFGDSDENGILDDAETYGGFLGVECFRLYGQETIEVLGDIHKIAVSNYLDNFPVQYDDIHCKSVMEFILIGDPSLKIGGYT
jgi:hypothetical protein